MGPVRQERELCWTRGDAAALSSHDVQAARPWGSAVQIKAEAHYACPPAVLFAVLTNPDNKGVLTDHRGNISRRAEAEEAGLRRVQVTPVAIAKILWLQKPVHLQIEQLEDRRDPNRLSMSFSLLSSDCLKTFEGCWTLEPMDGGTLVSYDQLLEPLLHLRLPGVYACALSLCLAMHVDSSTLRFKAMHVVHTLLSDLGRVCDRVAAGEPLGDVLHPAKAKLRTSLSSHPLADMGSSFTSAGSLACSLQGSPTRSPKACMSAAASSWDKHAKLLLPEDSDSAAGLLGRVPDTLGSAPAMEMTADKAEQQQGPEAVLGAQEQLQRAAISISPRGPLLQALWEQAQAAEANLPQEVRQSSDANELTSRSVAAEMQPLCPSCSQSAQPAQQHLAPSPTPSVSSLMLCTDVGPQEPSLAGSAACSSAASKQCLAADHGLSSPAKLTGQRGTTSPRGIFARLCNMAGACLSPRVADDDSFQL